MIWKIGFYYLGCDVIGQFLSLGEGHRYLNISLGGSAQLCIEKLCHGLSTEHIKYFYSYYRDSQAAEKLR